MRVLHVVTRYLRGGSETRIRDFVHSLPEAEHHLVIGAESDPELVCRELRPARLTMLPSLVREPNPISDVRALRALTRLLIDEPFDLVVTHQSKAGVVGRTAARRAGVPSIHSLSMASFGSGYPRWQDAVFRWLEARLASTTTAYAVVGEDLASRYATIGIPPSKLHVIRSGVRIPSYNGTRKRVQEEARRRFGLPARRPLVLYVGSLEARKNVLELPSFLSRLVGETPGARPFLAIAGQGPLFDRLAADLDEAGLGDDAALLGYVDDPGPLLAAANAVVLLSRTEGVPQVLVQSAALGTPFVAYRVDGVGELLELGAKGVAVPPGDLDAAVKEMAALLREKPSGHACPLDLSLWSPETIDHSYRRLVSSVLGPDLLLSEESKDSATSGT